MSVNAHWSGAASPGANRFAVDGDHTIADPVGPPRIAFPFDSDSHATGRQQAVLVQADNPAAYKYEAQDPFNAETITNLATDTFIIEQEFTIAADYFSPLARNTFYDVLSYAPDYIGTLDLSAAILVDESPTQDIGNGVLRWTRVYATVPPSRITYECVPFTFPGTGSDIIGVPAFDTSGLIPTPTFMPVPLNNGSPPVTIEITATVYHDYFVLDSGVNFQISTYTPDVVFANYKIPQFSVFYGVRFNETNQAVDNDWVSKYGFSDLDGEEVTAPANNSIPPKNESGVGNDADSGLGYNDMLGTLEICVRASVFQQWRGNIMERITYFAPAQ